MPNLSANRSADPWLRDPTATATPEAASRRSVTKVPAIPPVPRIPHRTGLPATSSSLRRPVPGTSLLKGRDQAAEDSPVRGVLRCCRDQPPARALPAVTVKFPVSYPTEKCVPLVRREPENRPRGVPAVANADLAAREA